jgi:hypothetical protein
MSPDDLNENRSPGPGVDVRGDPVIDPTKNVLDLVTAAIQRQDDLREADVRHGREAAALRDRYEDMLRQAEKERLEEKFIALHRELELVERYRVEQKADTEKAVQAALSAAKEAVQEQTAASSLATAKSEATTTSSIEQLGGTFTTAFEGFRRELGDLKDRLTSMESQRIGEAPNELRAAIASLTQRVDKIA